MRTYVRSVQTILLPEFLILYLVCKVETALK
jgi:hypothetical protein